MRIANAPVSWGIIEFDSDWGSLSYSQVLNEIRETGYEGTELGEYGFLPTDPNVLRRELVERELTLIGAFVPVALWDSAKHSDGLDRALTTAQLMADAGGQNAFIVLADDNATVEVRTQNAGRIGPEHGLRDGQWSIFCEGALSIARGVLETTGLRTVFHHHGGGYIETPSEVDELLNRIDPSLLGLCLDTGHFAFGGGDPAAAVGRYGDRIWLVHFKDFDREVAARADQGNWDYLETLGNRVFCELGQGVVDFPDVLSALREIKYEGWVVVEQDLFPDTGTPKESAIRNREYLRGLGL